MNPQEIEKAKVVLLVISLVIVALVINERRFPGGFQRFLTQASPSAQPATVPPDEDKWDIRTLNVREDHEWVSIYIPPGKAIDSTECHHRELLDVRIYRGMDSTIPPEEYPFRESDRFITADVRRLDFRINPNRIGNTQIFFRIKKYKPPT
jgi:hypothetical protein